MHIVNATPHEHPARGCRCGPCDAARAERESHRLRWEERNDAGMAEVRRRRAAYHRALRVLRDRYRDEFAVIYEAECVAEGVEVSSLDTAAATV